MKKKVPAILFLAAMFCIAVYIGVFIGRASSRNITTVSDAANYIPPPSEPPSALINLNEATEEDLLAIPGINQLLAERIIQYRDRFGFFLSVTELKYIDGMTDRIYQQIMDYVTVSP